MPLINVSNPANPRGSVIDPSNPTAQTAQTYQTTITDEGIKETTPLPVLPGFNTLNNQPKADIANNFDNKLNSVEQINQFVTATDNQPVIDQFKREEATHEYAQTDAAQPGAARPGDLQSLQPLPGEPLPTLKYSAFNFFELLKYAIKADASDVHLTVGYRPMIRVNGSLEVVSFPVLSAPQVYQCVLALIKTRQNLNPNNLYEADLTYTFEDRRFRVNIFRQMASFSIVMRIIPQRISTVEELGLPQTVKGFSKFSNGLVLVTGPTGSGKSTTIASLINLINTSEPKHIVTLEDPVEFVFPKGLGLVDQREFGIDFTSWDNALRSVLRQDPNVVLVGEMRDLDTIEAALQIAETGHLVFATLHTNGAAETINRIVDVFDSQKQGQIRVQLASVLKAVISQKLAVLNTGGRKAAVEVLISNASVKNAIRDQKTFQIDNIIQTNSEFGMISLEKSLIAMVKEGSITLEYAKTLSSKPNELDILLKN